MIDEDIPYKDPMMFFRGYRFMKKVGDEYVPCSMMEAEYMFEVG